jgi:dCTP deaminase
VDVKLQQAAKDLLDPVNAKPSDGAAAGAAGKARTATGILPLQELEFLVKTSREIVGLEPIQDHQFQPASLDLRLGATAYRVRASFLPGTGATVQERLADLTMHTMDITHGGVLERGCVYIVPLLESLALRYRMTAVGNPKSSTGRLDVFTRLITDNGTQFDRVPEQYRGPLYAEVSPRTFSILVRKGSRLNQLRIRRGSPPVSDPQMRALQREHGLVGALTEDDIVNGVPVTVDVSGENTSGLIGYRAKSHTGLIDVDRVRHYDVADFWDPVYAPRRGGLVLDPEDFYILASRQPVKVPDTHAAEMVAYDTLVGEFRVHYAGFFDPGFGFGERNAAGSRAVLEVRSFEVPFVIEDNQTVGRLMYERLTERPVKLYGSAANSYQGQGIALSKHFRQ